MIKHKRWCATQAIIPFGDIAERGTCNCRRQLSERGLQFMAAVRGIPTHHVTQALRHMTRIDWSGCSKSDMADDMDGSIYPVCSRVDIHQLSRMALARAQGNVNWRDA